jgi:outer membrane lipoprotein-sorting protein
LAVNGWQSTVGSQRLAVGGWRAPVDHHQGASALAVDIFQPAVGSLNVCGLLPNSWRAQPWLWRGVSGWIALCFGGARGERYDGQQLFIDMISFRIDRRLAPVLSLVSVLGCAAVGTSGPVRPVQPTTGAEVVSRMHAFYSGKWFQTMQFTQENTRFLANGRTDRSQWREYMLVPGRLRIEFLPTTGGNGAIYADGNVYSFEGNKLARTAAQLNILLLLTADVYAQSVETSTKQLTTLGVDLARFRVDTWNGRRTYVVGSTGAADLGSPQLWVDAETWLVMRVVDRSAVGGTTGPRPATEYRLSDYRTINGVPVVHEIVFLRDGQQFFKEQYTDVQLNTAIDARLFSSSQWRIPGRAQ